MGVVATEDLVMEVVATEDLAMEEEGMVLPVIIIAAAIMVVTVKEVREAKVAMVATIMEVKEVRKVKVVTIMEVKEVRGVKVVTTIEGISETKPKCCSLNNTDSLSDIVFESYGINESRRIVRFISTVAAFFHSYVAQSLNQIHDLSEYGFPSLYDTFYV